MFAHDGFRMELHTFYCKRFVTHRHDLFQISVFIFRPGSNFKRVRQGRFVYHQRMIPRGRQRIGQPRKTPVA